MPQINSSMEQNGISKRPEARTLEPPPGEWLFKIRDEVLGPVEASEVIERMFSGEVDESTEVSTGDGDWCSIQGIPDFLPFLYQAKAKIRAEQARLEAQRAARQRRIYNIIKMAIGALVLMVVAFGASLFLIIHRPWRGRDARAWAQKHVPLLSIPAASAAGLGPGSDHEDSGINISEIYIDDEPALVAIRATRSGNKRKLKKTELKSSGDKISAKGKKSTGTKTASVAMLTNEEINEVINTNIRRLFPCIQQERRRSSDLPARIIIEFSIKYNGRVGEVRMDNFKLQNTPLHQCFEQKLSKWKFRAYTGQVRNVEIPFNIGK